MGYPMNIGQAARAAGVTAKMIRHYEGLGLIPEANRTDSGYRQYSERDIAMLRFICQSRSMGFSIKQIEHLLSLWADSSRESRDVKALARAHIADLARKMAEMTVMKAALEQIVDDCKGDEGADCEILSKLSGGAVAGQKRATSPNPITKRAHTAKFERPDAGGLSAWMHGLHVVSGAAQT